MRNMVAICVQQIHNEASMFVEAPTGRTKVINTKFHVIHIPNMVRQYFVSGEDENKIQHKP